MVVLLNQMVKKALFYGGKEVSIPILNGTYLCTLSEIKYKQKC